MRANLGETPDYTDRSAVPQGTYHVVVDSAELVEKPGKTPYVKTVFTIVEGEHKGRKLFKNFTWTEKALPFMKGFLVAINYATDAEVEIDWNEWKGEQLAVRVTHKMFEGEPQAEVSQYIPLNEAGFSKAEDDEIPF